ncbi:hypothetical protein [Bremerella cremea]|uniref:hypothetical protein n=1 Tax=Bremerella cremea TaxID=1031537 RepID=UPI0031E991A1
MNSPIQPSPDRSAASLNAKLDQVLFRYQQVWLLVAIGWGLLTLLGGSFIAFWLDLAFELPAATRAAVPYVVFGASLGVVFVLAFRRLNGFAKPNVARLIDDTADARGTIVTGWDLLANGIAATSDNSTGLAQLAIARAGLDSERVDPAVAVSSRPLLRPWCGFGGLALVVLLMAAAFPETMQTQWKRFAFPWSDTVPASWLELTVVPGDVSVRYGDSLDIFVEPTDQPLEDVQLVLVRDEKEEVVPMFFDRDNRWRAVLMQLDAPTEYYVRAFQARSARHQIHIVTVPTIEKVTVEVIPPDYANGIGGYQGLLPQSGLAGLPGTKVRFAASSRRPLSGGSIMVTEGATVRQVDLIPSKEGPEKVVGELTLQSSGKFELHVIDIDAQESQESATGMITIVNDQTPFVRLMKPNRVSMATPNANLPVEVDGEDDYGLARVAIYRSLNGSRPLPLEVELPEPAPRRVQQSIYLPLASYGLQPGDQIKLFARVEDNHPGLAQGAETPVAIVHIISQEEYEKMLRAREGLNVLMSKYRQAQRMLSALQQKAKQLQKENEQKKGLVKKKDKEAVQNLADEMRKNAQSLAKAASRQLPYDSDQQLSKHLEQLAKQLEEAAEKLERQLMRLEGMGDYSQLSQQLGEMMEGLQQQSDLYGESAMMPLEQLEQIMPLLIAQNRLKQLVKAQNDLADRLKALRGKDGEDDPDLKARMRDLQEEQKAIRNELQEVADKLEEGMLLLPPGDDAEKIRQAGKKLVEALRSSGAGEEMSAAEDGLSRFSGTDGHEHAREAADKLSQFAEENDAMNQMTQQLLVAIPGLGPGLGKTASQLLGEMGLGGNGRGYSSGRSDKMGLFGSMEGMFAETGGGSDEERDSQALAVGAEGVNPDQPSMLDLMTPGGTSGAGLSNVPLRYRERVAQYFRRITEEAESSDFMNEDP